MLKNDRTICKNCYNKKKNRNIFIVSGKDVKGPSGSNKQIMDDKHSVSSFRKVDCEVNNSILFAVSFI